METETEISTPEQVTVDDTSVDVEPVSNADTSTAEPGTVDTSAETETKDTQDSIQEESTQELYAGKYKSVEELVNGYNEAQKFVNKAAEYEKKYNELVEKQAQELRDEEQKRLEQAQRSGFQTVEQQEIAQKVSNAEFQEYYNYVSGMNDENAIQIKSYLEQGYNLLQQGYVKDAYVYLNHVKSCFPGDFIEAVALEKSNLERQLTSQYQEQYNERINAESEKLATTLKADFAEFLSDLNSNEGKAKALKSFCDVGSINSKEDMQVFSDIYSQIAKYEREQAIKEYEAAKTIDETKNKAVITTGSRTSTNLSALKDSYTAQEIGAMSQAEYNALCDKYGEDEITKRIL